MLARLDAGPAVGCLVKAAGTHTHSPQPCTLSLRDNDLCSEVPRDWNVITPNLLWSVPAVSNCFICEAGPMGRGYLHEKGLELSGRGRAY